MLRKHFLAAQARAQVGLLGASRLPARGRLCGAAALLG